MNLEPVSKANPNFNSWRAAYSLGKGQRQLRNAKNKEVLDLARSSRPAIKSREIGAVDRYNAGLDDIAQRFVSNRSELRGGQRELTAGKRVASNVAQYPLRWSGAAAGTAVAGEGTRRVKKSDDLGPFGVEIMKKDYSKDPNYRPSVFQGVNPRSKTYVKRGTGLARVGGPYIGGMAGGVVGGAVGAATRNPTIMGAGVTAGSVGGASIMHTRNVKSGDTVGIHRKTGKKAKSKVGFADVSGFNY